MTKQPPAPTPPPPAPPPPPPPHAPPPWPAQWQPPWPAQFQQVHHSAPAVSVFGESWPGPGGQATPGVLWASALAGLAAAVALPLDRPGVGWFLVGLLVAVTTSAVAWRASLDASTEPRVHAGLSRMAWAATAVALLGVGTLRAAGWLFPLCVLAALVAGSLAVAGGRSLAGLGFGAVAVPVAAVRALPWGARGLIVRRDKTNSRRLYIAGSVAASLALLAIFAPLLAAADAAFARVLSDALPTVDVGSVSRWILLFGVVGLGMLGAAFLVLAPPSYEGTPRTRVARLRRAEWALPVGLLVALFAAFVGVQLAALFGGGDYVSRTTGLTYAEYARSGFWQLLAVTLLTLGVIGLAGRWAGRVSAGDRVWLRVLLGGLAGLTLVIVCSALSRMWAYQQAYGFTVLRVLVLAFELWLGAVYVLVIVAGARLRSGWLPSAVLGTGFATLLGLALLNPDRFIAEQNILRWEHTSRIDTEYLSGLSADAVPALISLPEPTRTCALAPLANRLAAEGSDDWRSWNSGRSAARDDLATYRPTSGSCPKQEVER